MTSKKKHTLNERRILKYVLSGLLRIDKRGRIWRKYSNNKWRRAENFGRKYYQVRVQENGVRVHAGASRLVWQCFYGNIENGLCINHKNGNKLDNHPGNLELVTHSENIKHAFRTGLKDQFGEKNPACKLSDDDVIKIRERYAKYKITQQQLADEYAVGFGTISKIIRGKRRLRQGGPLSMNNKKRQARGYYD